MDLPSYLVDYLYPAIFLLTVLESACVPIPSEITIGGAGALCSAAFVSQNFNDHQPANLVIVIILGILGSVVGSYLAYFVGRTGGRAAIDRWGKYILLTHADLDRSEAWFAKRGEPAVLIGRCVPVVRTFISLPAGMAEMEPIRFGIFSTLGIAVWVTGLAVLGYSLGDQFSKYAEGISYVGYAIAAIVAVMIVVFLWHRWRTVKAERAGGSSRGRHVRK
jgi:membrane protein DedA with SNARE-associated domain